MVFPDQDSTNFLTEFLYDKETEKPYKEIGTYISLPDTGVKNLI